MGDALSINSNPGSVHAFFFDTLSLQCAMRLHDLAAATPRSPAMDENNCGPGIHLAVYNVKEYFQNN